MVEYANGFNVLKSLSNEREVTLQWLRENILNKFSKRDQIRFLSVGSGPGDFDFAIIQELLSNGVNHITYTALEPSDIFTDILHKRYKENNPKISFDLKNESFETADLQKNYDLILFSHSLYYMSDKLKTIQKALNHLQKQTGLMALIHQSSTGVTQIQRNFIKRISLTKNPGMISEDLLEVFKEINDRKSIKYDHYIVWTDINVTEVLNSNSPIGPAFFQFLLNTDPIFITEDIMLEFRDFIENISYLHNGKILMKQPLGIYIVTSEK